MLNAARVCTVSALVAPLVIAAGTADAQQRRGQSVANLWQNNCISCHGANGQGGSAQSLLDGNYMTDGSNRALFESIKSGHADFGMPAYGETMSDAEVWGLTNYIRELQERARRRAEPAPHTTAENGVITSQHTSYTIETVVPGGLTRPWSVDFLPDGRMLIAERPGTLRVFENGELSEPVAGTPDVLEIGQGGLMDVVPHYDYASNGWIYLAYTHEAGGNRNTMTRIVRGKLDANRWTDEQVIWEAPRDTYLRTGLHFGARIVFDRKGHIFFGIGDRGIAPHAQDLARPNGKIHRVTEDGQIPSDNPFTDQDDALPSIWSYGHRNPQGLAYDHENDQLWETEHGPRGGDELNLVQTGKNYGWPLVSYGINYNGSTLVTPWPDLQGVEQDIEMPTLVWLPSTAACGLDVHRGDTLSAWNGDLFSGGLAGQIVERLRIRDGKVTEREEVVRDMGRVRDVVTGPDGSIYVVLNRPDSVIRLTAPASRNR